MKKLFHKTVTDSPKKKSPVGWLVVFGLVVGIVVGLVLIVDGNWREINFAIQHPEFVNELRVVYEHEHSQADENVLLRQRMELGEVEVESAKKE